MSPWRVLSSTCCATCCSRNSASRLPGRRGCVASLVGVCDRSAEEQEPQRVARFPRAPPGRRGGKAAIFPLRKASARCCKSTQMMRFIEFLKERIASLLLSSHLKPSFPSSGAHLIPDMLPFTPGSSFTAVLNKSRAFGSKNVTPKQTPDMI